MMAAEIDDVKYIGRIGIAPVAVNVHMDMNRVIGALWIVRNLKSKIEVAHIFAYKYMHNRWGIWHKLNRIYPLPKLFRK